MTIHDARVLDAAVRTDLLAFIEKCMTTLAPATVLERNWHLHAIAYQLERCRRGEIRRLIITLPPRHLKSVCCSVAFSAWILGHRPSDKILCTSYNAELAASFARDTRDVIDSEWYRRVFPQTRLSRKRSADTDFMTTKRGGRYAVSTGGALTGRGGRWIIIDDPIKSDNVQSDVMREKLIRWFQETLITRLDDKRNDIIIVVMQRLHVDDLAGHLLPTGDWHHLDLPAIAQEDESIPVGPDEVHTRRKGELLHPQREPLHVLEQLKRDMGPRAFNAQYLQRPLEPDGGIIRYSWFKMFEGIAELREDDEIVQSWDTASKVAITNDYSVCTTWLVRGDEYYLGHVFCGRCEYPDLRRKIIELASFWKADRVLIEDAASGQALIQEFQRERPEGATWWVEPIKPAADKVQRAKSVSGYIEAGRVHLLSNAAYLPALRAEIVRFPRGHDDQIDSITQFLAWATSRIKYANIKQYFVY